MLKTAALGHVSLDSPVLPKRTSTRVEDRRHICFFKEIMGRTSMPFGGPKVFWPLKKSHPQIGSLEKQSYYFLGGGRVDHVQLPNFSN